jgi:hypothetical protein
MDAARPGRVDLESRRKLPDESPVGVKEEELRRLSAMKMGMWRGFGRVVWLVVLSAPVAGLGCKKLAEKLTGGASGSSTVTSVSTGASTSAVAAQKPEFTDEAIAFMFGRKYAFACLYAQLDKPTEANAAITTARTLAGALGVAEPVLPAKTDGFRALRAKTIPDELTKKKNAKVSAVFSLGVSLTDGWFGAMLGSDTATAVAEIERHAKAAGLPESVWKTQLDGIKAKSSEDKIKKLAADIEAHYKS